ncbi:hypothetical protein R3P38DRAFT_2575719, partial [Favolaschia claudopus]
MYAAYRADKINGPVTALAADTNSRPYLVVVDSGATEHCFWRRDDFIEYHPVELREGNAAEGSKFRILATGTVRKTFTFAGRTKEITFSAIHSPDITANLISISKLDEKGCAVEFTKGKATFKDRNGVPFMEARLVDGMYRVDFDAAGVTAAWTARSRASP